MSAPRKLRKRAHARDVGRLRSTLRRARTWRAKLARETARWRRALQDRSDECPF